MRLEKIAHCGFDETLGGAGFLTNRQCIFDRAAVSGDEMGGESVAGTIRAAAVDQDRDAATFREHRFDLPPFGPIHC